MEKTFIKEIKQLGLKVKFIRESQSMTQQELASRCDVDIRTIQRIEKGEFGFGMHILFALSNALKIKPTKLLEEIEFE
ncbi:MAG: helix-turn-helix domain-containing protein [Cytophagales bacterium]|nr:helix-turn-helix domain-containing protein [Cytophagales bacterium]